MTTFDTLTSDIQTYTTYTETTFVAEIPTFIRAAEERIWYFVQLPFFRKTSTGALTLGNRSLTAPTDFLAAASFAIVVSGEHRVLINKDPNYIREVYPTAATLGVPVVYAMSDATTFLFGPTPAAAYATELEYFFRPASLTAGAGAGTTWLSVNAYDTLLYGSLVEAANFMKRTAGIDSMGDKYDERFLTGLQGLKNLGEVRDRKDTYRSGEKRGSE